MAADPANQAQFAEDVAAAAAAGGDSGFVDPVDPNSENFKMPSADEVWKIIEGMEGISDEERESLRDSLFNPQDLSADELVKRMAAQPQMGHTSWDYVIFFTMLAIIAVIFALFGYKLYKSLVEKEQRKLEKQKLKKSKKTKKAN